MRKIVSFVLVCAVALCMFATFTGCSKQADHMSYNVSKEADNFNVIRRLSVINIRSDRPVFELVAAFSINVDNTDNQLEVTCETGPNEYKKHFMDISSPEIMYFVEDISGASVSKYYYEVNFQPEMLLPITFTSND